MRTLIGRPAEGLPPTLGWLARDWIEHFLVFGPGDKEGEPAQLSPEMVEFVLDAYSLRSDGTRMFRQVFLSRPKGWAKSMLAAWLSLFEAMGPCRFDGWTADRQPYGRPQRNPQVIVVANSEEQADETTYGQIRYIALNSPKLIAQYPMSVGYTRTLVGGSGIIEPASSQAATRDGARTTFAVIDEPHLMVLPGIQRLTSVVQRNVVKRRAADGWSMMTSTAYRPGENSVAEQMHVYAERVAEGLIGDPGLLLDHREAGPEHDLDDADQRLAALGEAYGPAADHVNTRAIAAMYDDPTVDRSDWIRYFCNRIVRYTDSWMDPKLWDSLGTDAELQPNDPVALGFDGSSFDDATSLVAARLTDGVIFELATWERPDRLAFGAEWEVPRDEVRSLVAETFDRYDVARCYADPPQWQSEIDTWALMWPDAVKRWHTGRDVPMAAALERFLTDARGHRLHHARSETLDRHVGNARVVYRRGRKFIAKDTRRSSRKIDAAMAAVLAWEARADALADNYLTQRAEANRPQGVFAFRG